MKKAVVTNTNGTLIPDWMDIPGFRALYSDEYGQDAVKNYTDSDETREMKRAVRRKYKERFPYQLYPNARELIASIRESCIGLVVYAGAPADKSEQIYRKVDIIPDGIYSSKGHDRSDPNTFLSLREEMISEIGIEPVAYLTHIKSNASAAADAWGRALLCAGIEEPDSRIYSFDWDSLSPEETEKIICFLKF